MPSSIISSSSRAVSSCYLGLFTLLWCSLSLAVPVAVEGGNTESSLRRWMVEEENDNIFDGSPSPKLPKQKQKNCLRSCPNQDILTPQILQKCIDLCQTQKLNPRCCGNRLNGEATQTSSGLLSCSNGCEMAYYIGMNTNPVNVVELVDDTDISGVSSVVNDTTADSDGRVITAIKTTTTNIPVDYDGDGNTDFTIAVDNNSDGTDANVNVIYQDQNQNQNRFLRQKRRLEAEIEPSSSLSIIASMIDTCKSYCIEANQNTNNRENGCAYRPPYAEQYGLTFIKDFLTCGSCQESCTTRVDDQECFEGCELAARLYNTQSSSDNNNNVFYNGYFNEQRDGEDESEESVCEDVVIERFPRFLFAGQSNIIGHSGEARKELFDELIEVVNTRPNTGSQDNKVSKLSTTTKTEAPTSLRNEMIVKLKAAIEQGQQAKVDSAQHEAELIYKLSTKTAPGTTTELSALSATSESTLSSVKGRGLLDMDIILNPNPNVLCSLTVPSTMPSLSSTLLDCERPVSPTACGHSNENYGPELMFSHTFTTLYKSPYNNNSNNKIDKFGIVKVGQGGTQIQQWLNNDSKNRGRILDGDTTKKDEIVQLDNYWLTLRDSIHAAAGTIEAFVWFQGENEDLGSSSSSDIESTYYERLRTLVSDVRYEILLAYTNNKDKNNNKNRVLKFETPNDIPVVIIELGSCFAEAAANAATAEDEKEKFPGPIIAAQRKFVKNDSNSAIVNTGADEDPTKQLSQYYHYDAATVLVIGDRIAKALAKLSSSQYAKQEEESNGKRYRFESTSEIPTTTTTSFLTKTDPDSFPATATTTTTTIASLPITKSSTTSGEGRDGIVI